MLKKLMVVSLAALLVSTSGLVLAKQGGGNAGGKSDTHMSNQGVANTNGPEAVDRDKGKDRAEDRRSEKGQEHEKAGVRRGKKR